jgi:hypothetical protein
MRESLDHSNGLDGHPFKRHGTAAVCAINLHTNTIHPGRWADGFLCRAGRPVLDQQRDSGRAARCAPRPGAQTNAHIRTALIGRFHTRGIPSTEASTMCGPRVRAAPLERVRSARRPGISAASERRAAESSQRSKHSPHQLHYLYHFPDQPNSIPFTIHV